jgi:hypothetical protein
MTMMDREHCEHCGKVGPPPCPACGHLSPTERRNLELLREIRDLLRYLADKAQR